ncbi:MAG: type II secretion system protein M [Deltaproteobacteria bacterium]|nr:type II secretion system protein M [Deltaproteobacteria bacterium]
MKLARREKFLIGGAGVILLVFLIIYLVVLPFYRGKDKLKKETKELELVIERLVRSGAGSQTMESISESLERVLSARGDISLRALINKEAEASGITKNILSMKPSENKRQVGNYIEDIVELRLVAVTPTQLTEFLNRTERPEMFIYTNRINISDNKKEEGYLDVTIRMLTYKRI